MSDYMNNSLQWEIGTKMKQSRYVLFADPQKQVAFGACYIAMDGYSTKLRSNAARFRSFTDAKEIAAVTRIALNDHT
jgi:hypothetical protein